MIQQQASNWNRGGEPPRESAQDNPGHLSQCMEFIASNPGLSVAIGLGVGFGAGLAIASLMQGQGSTDYYSRAEALAERVGHRVADTFKNANPSSWKNPFHS